MAKKNPERSFQPFRPAMETDFDRKNQKGGFYFQKKLGATQKIVQFIFTKKQDAEDFLNDLKVMRIQPVLDMKQWPTGIQGADDGTFVIRLNPEGYDLYSKGCQGGYWQPQIVKEFFALPLNNTDNPSVKWEIKSGLSHAAGTLMAAAGLQTQDEDGNLIATNSYPIMSAIFYDRANALEFRQKLHSEYAIKSMPYYAKSSSPDNTQTTIQRVASDNPKRAYYFEVEGAFEEGKEKPKYYIVRYTIESFNKYQEKADTFEAFKDREIAHIAYQQRETFSQQLFTSFMDNASKLCTTNGHTLQAVASGLLRLSAQQGLSFSGKLDMLFKTAHAYRKEQLKHTADRGIEKLIAKMLRQTDDPQQQVEGLHAKLMVLLLVLHEEFGKITATNPHLRSKPFFNSYAENTVESIAAQLMSNAVAITEIRCAKASTDVNPQKGNKYSFYQPQEKQESSENLIISRGPDL